MLGLLGGCFPFIGFYLHDFKVLVGYDFDIKTKIPQLNVFSLCSEIKGKRRNGASE